MKLKHLKLLLLSLFTLHYSLFAAANGAPTLAPIFCDGLVLQQNRPVAIWGTSTPSDTITIEFASQKITATADSSGRWLAHLAPLPANSTPAELTVRNNTGTLTVRDILVGEVWLCSGQSNMEWNVASSGNSTAEIAAANHPQIRHFKVEKTVSPVPLETAKGEWLTCSPASVGNFSATAYYFARALQQRLQVPIGLLNSSWGGTQIESWMSAQSISESPWKNQIAKRWQQMLSDFAEQRADYEARYKTWQAASDAAKKQNKPFTKNPPRALPGRPNSPWLPSSLYNAMIHPFLPMSFRGVIWYQGESNVERADQYHDLFPRMIRQWRADFNQSDLPFYFVQIANCIRKTDPSDTQWAFLREAQLATLKNTPHTGMVVTIDIGDDNNIHPANKQEVGRRLALLAFDKTYNLNGASTSESAPQESHSLLTTRYSLLDGEAAPTGPLFQSATLENNSIRIHFTHATGLHSDTPVITGFEIAGADQSFHPATATIDNSTIRVSSDKVPSPRFVRYAWNNAPRATILRNSSNLPASPFRSSIP